MAGWGAVVGSILGFGASVVPDLITMLREHLQYHRDMKQAQQNIEATLKGLQVQSPVTVNVQPSQCDNGPCDDGADDFSRRDAYAEDTTNVPPFVILLRAAVRPAITYSFFTLFALIKLAILVYALTFEHTPVVQLLPIIWDEDSVGLFAAVVSFWFGSRALLRYQSKRQPVTRTVVDDLKGHSNPPVESEEP